MKLEKISVDFSGTIRLSQFPEYFERFVSTDDAVLQGMEDDAIKEKTKARQIAEEIRLKVKKAEDKAAMETPQAVSRNPFPARAKSASAARQACGDDVSVAFKCNFCEGGSSDSCIGFHGKCPDSMIWYNIKQAEHVVCSDSSVCRRYRGIMCK